MEDTELKIKALLVSKKMSLEILLAKINVTKQGYYYMLKNKTLKVETLLKIAEALEVPVSHFFDDTVKTINQTSIVQHNFGDSTKLSGHINSTFNGSTNENDEIVKMIIDGKDKEIEYQKNEIELLKAQLVQYREQIKLKDEIIEMLREKNNN